MDCTSGLRELKGGVSEDGEDLADRREAVEREGVQRRTAIPAVLVHEDQQRLQQESK